MQKPASLSSSAVVALVRDDNLRSSSSFSLVGGVFSVHRLIELSLISSFLFLLLLAPRFYTFL